MKKKYNILVDFRVQGYNVKGGILKVIREIWKNKKATIVITRNTK